MRKRQKKERVKVKEERRNKMEEIITHWHYKIKTSDKEKDTKLWLTDLINRREAHYIGSLHDNKGSVYYSNNGIFIVRYDEVEIIGTFQAAEAVKKTLETKVKLGPTHYGGQKKSETKSKSKIFSLFH